MDKNTAVIKYLLTCPSIKNNPLFFNCIQAQDNTKDIITIANERVLHTAYIDGSIDKRYSFTIQDFRSMTPNPLAFVPGEPIVLYSNENLENMLDVQGIIDWIEEQNDARNFPDFGDKCIIDEIRTVTDNPALNGIDNNVTPALGKYSVTVQIDYLDKTKTLY